MARKMYHGPLADVSYDRDICQHSGECVRGMPQVFDVSARPWIDPETVTTEAEREQLAQVIGRCPSGALRIHPPGTTAP